MAAKRHITVFDALIAAPFLLIALGIAAYGTCHFSHNVTFRQTSFSSLEEFSEVWQATPTNERYLIVGWLLGDTPRRHTPYPLANCPLAGLSKEEVLEILGPSSIHEGATVSSPTESYSIPYEVFYPIGSIEYDVLGLSADNVHIEFDENGIVRKVETSS